jgi:tetratricopeptide (TPR) repeat protein
MVYEFDLSIDFNDLIKKLRAHHFSGEFSQARGRIEGSLIKIESTHGQGQENVESSLKPYNPVLDVALAELHVIASATYDRLGEYTIAGNFVIRWASEVQLRVMELSRTRSEAGSSSETKNPLGKGQPVASPQATADGQWFWYVRILFLQQCGISMYRMSRFEMARGYLRDALFLSQFLLEDLRNGLHPPLKLEEVITAYSNSCYWLGCVETYANEFQQAEEYFTNGLKAIASHLEGAHRGDRPDSEDDKEDKARCSRATARLLLGLGLLRFHMGALAHARSDLLSAKVLFLTDPGEISRRLRADLLLLSVDRVESSDDQEKLMAILDELLDLQEKFSAAGTRHDRYRSRTRWTIGLIKLDLADLYWRPGDLPKHETEKERAALLADALKIATEENSRAYGSQSDQLQFEILKIRTYRRLQQFKTAIDLGTVLINAQETRNHPLLHTEILISTGHACFNLWQAEKRREFLFQAQSLITEAAERSLKNPRAQAVCRLHLARIASALGQTSLAEKEFERWTYIASVIDKVKWIELFAKRVREQLDAGAGDAFVVRMSELPETRAYDEMMRRLKRFLLDRVVADNKKEVGAYVLGVSRQTLHSWEQELEDGGHFKVKRKVPVGRKQGQQ